MKTRTGVLLAVLRKDLRLFWPLALLIGGLRAASAIPHRARSIMTRRSQSLGDALVDVDAGTLANVVRIVVNEDWWETLSSSERATYTRQCVDRGITLSTDDRISRHFVELVGRNDPPLSSERRL